MIEFEFRDLEQDLLSLTITLNNIDKISGQTPGSDFVL
jgi:hypothetical protein